MHASKRGGQKAHKECEVCGDKAKSLHFGGISCDSCKAFFRRSVQNDVYLSFKCAGSSSTGCKITIASRKICQYCRFQKCLAIGMEKSWVMSEDERTRMNRERQMKKMDMIKGTRKIAPEETKTSQEYNKEKDEEEEKKEEEESEESKYETPYIGMPKPDDMLKFMTIEEQGEIEKIVHIYYEGYAKCPYKVSGNPEERTSVETIKMFTTILRRFAYFANQIYEFNSLEKKDKIGLLRNSVLEMVLLRSAICFDSENNCWPKASSMLSTCPKLKVEQMEKLVSKELYELHLDFIKKIKELNVDEPCVMLLLVIVLFSDRFGIKDIESVNVAQDKYLGLLEKYIKWRYPLDNIFPKLLSRLVHLRELNDSHTEYNLKLTTDDIVEIKNALGTLNLNPYPQFEIIKIPELAESVSSKGIEENLEIQSSVIEQLPPPPIAAIPSSFIHPQYPQHDPNLLSQFRGQIPPSFLTSQSSEHMQQFFRDFVNRTIPVILDNPEETIESGFLESMSFQTMMMQQHSSSSSRMSIPSQMLSSLSSSGESSEYTQQPLPTSQSQPSQIGVQSEPFHQGMRYFPNPAENNRYYSQQSSGVDPQHQPGMHHTTIEQIQQVQNWPMGTFSGEPATQPSTYIQTPTTCKDNADPSQSYSWQ